MGDLLTLPGADGGLTLLDLAGLSGGEGEAPGVDVLGGFETRHPDELGAALEGLGQDGMGLDGIGKGGVGRAVNGDERFVEDDDGRRRREEIIGLDIAQIGEVIGVGTEEMNGHGTNAVLREEASEAHLASDALEDEIATAEIEDSSEALLDLGFDKTGKPFADIAIIGGGWCGDSLEIAGEGGVGAVGIGDDDVAALALSALDSPSGPPGFTAGAAAEGNDEFGVERLKPVPRRWLRCRWRDGP